MNCEKDNRRIAGPAARGTGSGYGIVLLRLGCHGLQVSAALTPGQEARLVGVTALLEQDGRTIAADTGETFVGLIEDIPALLEPVEIARSKSQVFVNVTALKGAVTNPRTVTTMNEEDYGSMKVLKYIESRGDELTWKWMCEAQREYEYATNAN